MPPLLSSPHTMVSIGELARRHITMPLAHVKDWSPFQIDALGLVTLLGADEVNQSVGTLQHRRFTEYLPLLAAFVIAGDRFVTEQPGFVLYNLTDGITSTELKGWFTRWLMSQSINNATTVLVWKTNPQKKGLKDVVAPVLSFVLVMPLLVITILVGDWYGVGNAAAIIISILTRVYLLHQRRHARDTVASAPKDGKENPEKKLCIIRSDGKMVACKVPQSVLNTFVKNSDVKHPTYYHCARWLCWLALGVHMCILGMCSLFTQIYTVFLLVLSTWWFTSDFAWDLRRVKEENVTVPGSSVFRLPFNRAWSVEQTDHQKTEKGKSENDVVNLDKRQIAWARFGLDEEEEKEMDRWNLFPIKEKNKKWWDDYEDLKKSYRDSNNEKLPGTPQAQASTARPQMPSTPTPSTNLLVENASQPAGTLDPSLSSTSTQNPSRSSSPGGTSTAEPSQTDPKSSL
jgi:hypothetical protein